LHWKKAHPPSPSLTISHTLCVSPSPWILFLIFYKSSGSRSSAFSLSILCSSTGFSPKAIFPSSSCLSTLASHYSIASLVYYRPPCTSPGTRGIALGSAHYSPTTFAPTRLICYRPLITACSSSSHLVASSKTTKSPDFPPSTSAPSS
jgi:hypothetical protein